MSERYITTDDGVRLFCRIKGRGKPVLLIHGVMVDGDFYAEVQELLSVRYRVITYDRRGYSRSAEGEDYSIERQARDAANILETLTHQKAVVVGCSAGALTALKLKELFPEKVGRLFVHEPPLVSYEEALDEGVRSWFEEIRAQIAKGRINRAILTFVMGTAENQKPDPRARALSPETVQRQMENGKIFITKEFAECFDEERRPFLFSQLHDPQKITVLVGDSSGESYCAKAAKALAEDLNTSLYYVPGGHNGARDLPFEFTAAILGLLEIYQGELKV